MSSETQLGMAPVILIAVGLLLLACWIALGLFQDIPGSGMPIKNGRAALVPLGQIESVVASTTSSVARVSAGDRSPFFTVHFQSDPTPLPPPPPPPENKVEVVYLGFIKSSSGQASAFFRVGDKTLRHTAGEPLAKGFSIAKILTDNVTLTNAAGALAKLKFRKPFTLTGDDP